MFKTTSILRGALSLLLAGGLFGSGLEREISPPPPADPQTAPPTQSADFSNFLPFVQLAGSGSEAEWNQHAHDALRTGYSPSLPPAPWRWKWAWNGPNASGAVSSGKFGLPRNSQPVTGGGQVFIAAGSRGVFALSQQTGQVIWNVNPGGAQIRSTPAYGSGSLFVLASNGTLYKLDARNGAIQDQFATGQAGNLPLPPALHGDRVWFCAGNRLYALLADTLDKVWEYDAGSPVHTPPAYSPTADRVVIVSQDLYVHAVQNNNGAQAWRVKPTPLSPGDPGDNTDYAEAAYGWPVIAEAHGLVLVKLRLDWDTLWNPWSPWPETNAAMRAGLTAQPQYQALFALRLSDGGAAFSANIGHGGFGDGGYLPMGPMPVIRRLPDGQELAYVVMRGAPCLVGGSACDGRGDSRLGEMPLDSLTVPGYQAGDVRFMENTFFPTDEQAFLSMAGDALFGGHWMYGIAHQILDRSASRGSGSAPITVSNLPHVITSANNCAFSPSHFCPDSLVQDGDGRVIPGGFYIYYNQGAVYDAYWSGYAAWVISGDMLYFVSTDGALVALEPGDPQTQGVEILAQAADPGASGAAPLVSLPDMPVRIPYTAARSYAGRLAAVEGTLRWVFNNGKAVYLGFKNPHQGAFLVRIPRDDWDNFPHPPESLYQAGMQVRVTGWIGWYQGDPHIFARSPAQIQVLNGGTSP